MNEQPNILFIVVDALRARNLGCYGYSRPTSPNIDNLAKKGILFEKAFSCAVCTYPSLTTLFSGNYPLSHGIVDQMVSDRDVKRLIESGTIFLPEILKSKGYTTLAIEWLGKWLKRGYDYYSGIILKRRKLFRLIAHDILRAGDIRRAGFMAEIRNFILHQSIHHEKLMNLTARRLKLRHLQAEVVTDKAINLVKKVHDKKFFLFAHYWDTHAPYDPPKHYFRNFIEDDYGKDQSIEEALSPFRTKKSFLVRRRIRRGVKSIKEVLARYDGAIKYVDHEIGRLTETLENFGILDKTLIVLTSDHGESLTEHGIYFSHHGLYDVTTHVPLILAYPGSPTNRRIRSLIQHTDVAPTLLDVLEIENRGFDMDGRSAVPLIDDDLDKVREVAYIEETVPERKRAVRTEKYKYILSRSREDAMCEECECVHGGIEELYDLDKDPQETSNVLEESPHEAKRLKEEIFRWTRLLTSKRKKKPTRKIKKADLYYSAEEEKLITERLRELGYF